MASPGLGCSPVEITFDSTNSPEATLIVVNTGAVVLLPASGSLVSLPTTAMLVATPEAGAVTVRVRFVTAPAARSPRLFQTTWLLSVELGSGNALTYDTPAGKLSVTTRLVAVDGPALLTTIE